MIQCTPFHLNRSYVIRSEQRAYEINRYNISIKYINKTINIINRTTEAAAMRHKQDKMDSMV